MVVQARSETKEWYSNFSHILHNPHAVMQHFTEFFNRNHFTIINKGTSSDLWKESEKECKTLFPWSNKLNQKTTVSMKFNFFYILPKKFHNRGKLINAIYEHRNPCFSEFFANHFLLRERGFLKPPKLFD